MATTDSADELSESLTDIRVDADADVDADDPSNDDNGDEAGEEVATATGEEVAAATTSTGSEAEESSASASWSGSATDSAINSDANVDSTNDAAATARHDRAVAQATASADAAYRPCATILNSTDSSDLIAQVDGILLTNERDMEKYSSSTLTYQAKNVPLKLRQTLEIPIHVGTSGSVVQYKLTTQNYDIGFSIVAHRGFSETENSVNNNTATTTNDNDGATDETNDNDNADESETNDNSATTKKSSTADEVVKVRDMSRVNAHERSIEGKFLVGTVPTRLVFTLDNSYSWFREKVLSYEIKVTPPSFTTIVSGRRRRAKSALGIVQEDCSSAAGRLAKTQRQAKKLAQQMEALKLELEQKQKSLKLAKEEQEWLATRVKVRKEQSQQLESRLSQGWPDEALLLALKQKLALQEQQSVEGGVAHATTTRTAPATADDVAKVMSS